MNVADCLIEILRENGINTIFGLPGEQILPFYKALQKSDIRHILVRHEESAAHAAEAYSKVTNNIGVCLATAGPGALNLVMGVGTAYKDSVPMLVLTGDNPTYLKDTTEFQSFPLSDVFDAVCVKSFDPLNAEETIMYLMQALEMLKNSPTGPIHVNLPRDILLEENFDINPIIYVSNYDEDEIEFAYNFIRDAKRPFIILGAGATGDSKKIEELVKKHKIPVATTFTAKGIIRDSENINLGLLGSRGTNRSEYAFNNSDCIIALGTRLTNRTIKDIDEIEDKLIHVNIDQKSLVGEYPINNSVEFFLDNIDFGIYDEWLEEILAIENDFYDDGIDDESLPLRPQSAINTIYDYFGDNITIADAGSHTTWTTILKNSDDFYKLIYSGGFAPMGYGVPASIGAAIGKPQEKIIVINGDGGFQMNVQELATIKQYNLNVLIFVLNNSEYGVIRQSQEKKYGMEAYQTELLNPDFVELAKSYGVGAQRVETKIGLEKVIKEQKDSKNPYVVEIVVRREDIPLPK